MARTWDACRPLAFDFETSGTHPTFALQPWRIPSGACWATSLVGLTGDTPRQEFGGINPTRAQMEQMLVQARDERRTLVGWNVTYDIMVLLGYGLEELVMECQWLDAMLLWRHLTIEPEYEIVRHRKKSYSLKEAVREFLPQYAGYEADVDFHDPSPEARKKLHHYNRQDVAFTLTLAKRFYEQLAASPAQLRAAMIEAQCLPLAARANFHGIPVEPFAARQLQTHLDHIAAEQLVHLAPHGVTEQVIRSPTKLAALLFDQWGLPVYKENTGKKTGKVSRSTDKEVLHELAFQDERVARLRIYRGALGNKTKFADTPLKSVDYNEAPVTRPQAIVFGTYTGRLTYASKQGRLKADTCQIGFALHQSKRGKEFRNILIPPPDHVLVEFDAAGQEFRWMAIASQDPTMQALCMPGEDPHSFMGARIAGDEYRELIRRVHDGDKTAKEHRQLGKVGNLSLQFRTSARKLRKVARVDYGIDLHLDTAQRVRTTYLNTYTHVPVYWAQQIQKTKRLGYVETLAGRRVQVEGNWDGEFGWSMGSTAINYRIQGTGADQKYLALAVLRPVLREFAMHFAWDLHDGIYFYVPRTQLLRAVPRIRALLNALPYKQAWGLQPPIPLTWDCKVGRTWGSLQEIDDGDEDGLRAYTNGPGV